ncbi:MAG: flagellar basal body P-ring formation protein FlgA [Rhodospirillaceae bacterium]|nr:flagellar basal body P-ring formation protein FlgA [Rhodospirillaceae bacterium]
MRIIIIATLILIGGTSFDAFAKSFPTETNVMVRNAIKVDAAVIKLGDLFTVKGEKAETAVAYAPQPGKRATFDAKWLYRVARAYKLNWRPINDRIRAVVVRESQVISNDEIHDAIRDALVEKGADPNTEIVLSNKFLKFHVAGGSLSGVAVDEINFQRRSQRFTAIISAPAGDANAKQIRVSGRLYQTVEVPVLSRRVLAGETIKEEDIKWIKLRSGLLQANTVTGEAELIGKTPRRGLRAGFPILASSVRRPILVAKGSLITMVLRAPKMLLTAQGKALDNGSDGDVIRINNTQSNKIVEAEVIGHGRVAVRTTSMIAMN